MEVRRGGGVGGGVGGGFFFFFFFKQKTAYEIGTGDWSSDVCSSDLYCGLSTPCCFNEATIVAVSLKARRAFDKSASNAVT